jgi:hypothetical protein
MWMMDKQMKKTGRKSQKIRHLHSQTCDNNFVEQEGSIQCSKCRHRYEDRDEDIEEELPFPTFEQAFAILQTVC